MEIGRFFTIRQEMNSALNSGDLDLAENLAIEFLELAKSNLKSWNYGNAIHHANLMLGKISLIYNDIEQSKKYLIKASKTIGSPQLNSFGPNMSLAKELLEIGESEIVLLYINNTRKFWVKKFSWQKTKNWENEIRKGLIPDFKGNLIY